MKFIQVHSKYCKEVVYLNVEQIQRFRSCEEGQTVVYALDDNTYYYDGTPKALLEDIQLGWKEYPDETNN